MKKIISGFKTVLITLIITAILGEITMRLYSSAVMNYDVEMHKYALSLKRKSEVKGLTHEHIPGESKSLMGVDIEINKDGFRDTFTPSDNKNEYRVLVVGSSITMGWGVEYDSVWTSKLDKKFNDKSIEFVNTGIGNYNTTLEETAFYHNAKKVQPDHVILHYYINDAEIVSSKSSNLLIKHSYLAAFLYVKYQQIMFANEGTVSSIGEYYWNIYEKSEGWNKAKEAILRMKEYCKKNNLAFDVIVQPDLHNFSDDSFQIKIHGLINDFLTENQIGYLDLFDAYKTEIAEEPSKIWVNPDDSHPNHVGHNILFKEVSNYFIKNYPNVTNK